MRQFRFAPIATATIATATTFTLSLSAAAATLSDAAYEYMQEKYSLELQGDRSSCGYSIDPNDVKVSGDRRVTTVTVTRARNPLGTGCAGVRDFMLMDVDCAQQTGEFLRLSGSGRSARWEGMPMTSDAVATVCQLPK
jgi:hypothetical protein